jgi:hypothetical protein
MNEHYQLIPTSGDVYYEDVMLVILHSYKRMTRLSHLVFYCTL